jgi:integrase/recombinase XerD
VLTASEAELILHQPNVTDPLGIRDRTMLEVFYSTRMWRTELLRLKLYDVDRAAAIVTIREGKGRKDRVIPVRLRRGKKSISSGFVFANREGKPYVGTSINRMHRHAIGPKMEGKRRPIFAGDFVLHSLRHTMLTRLGESGVDAFTIMRIAGHSSIVVSQRYIHPTPEAVERAFERLQLSAHFAVTEQKRLPPAAVSATLNGKAAVSH